MPRIATACKAVLHGVRIAAIASVLFACTVAVAPRDSASQQFYDDRELIVLTRPPALPLIETAQALGYGLKSSVALDDLDEVLVVLQIAAGKSIPDAIAEIEAAVPGVTAGAHHLYRVQTGARGTGGYDFANAMLHWPDSGCRAAQSIGLIDAGVTPAAGGLANDRIVQRNFANPDARPATDHGTLMAELLLGPGRLTRARLFSANVVDPARDQGDVAGVVAILQAIDWLKASGVRLVNVSLAGPRNKLLDRAMTTATGAGMTFVAAAGNAGPTAAPLFPAAFPYVLAVTAVDRDQQVYRQAVQGDHINFAGPGVDIVIQSGGRTRILSGTSAAVPFVTAAIAADPALRGRSINDIRAILAARAIDLGAVGPDPVFGHGLVTAPSGCVN